jgi:hypothetical protein
MVIKRMIYRALGNERRDYDSGHAHTISTEVKAVTIPRCLPRRWHITGRNGGPRTHGVIKPPVFIVDDYQQARIRER